ncbi:MAG TPA: hypothetical protein VGK32_12685 [Vicinamibacterales bacterium]|jgi:hypothetical protein
MLDLWRPPNDAGDPVGCLATTYTFTPGLFDEQCLARFLDIDSEPNREDLAFLLERERQLDRRYAGVLVDHTQAGVEHSLRWDVLPVRIRAGKQHAKLSLLAWSQRIRVIVTSANVTDPGYRFNHEVSASVDLTPGDADLDILGQAIEFLRSLVSLVQGASVNPPEVVRARGFLDDLERQTRKWKHPSRRTTVRQQLACTLPRVEADGTGRSSLQESIDACRRRGGSPTEVRVASPFFDVGDESGRVTAELCKAMARGAKRQVFFSVPSVHNDEAPGLPRLAAPRTLLTIPPKYAAEVTVEILPETDQDKNPRPWHAKMLSLRADGYFALMIGSSNFTCAGMGVGHYRNAEANLLSIADSVDYGRDTGRLEAVWPDVEEVDNPEMAEWLGVRPPEGEKAKAPVVPDGFLAATYCAGDTRQIVLRFEPDLLRDDWAIHACGRHERELLAASKWVASGRRRVETVKWQPVEPPDRLLVRWGGCGAYLPLNVEDSRHLPPPSTLQNMTADDMLLILAASDPSAAIRGWIGRGSPNDYEGELDSATPIDLDPLRRYDLQATFLHRIRRRARVLAQLRESLQRPVWGRQGLDWRLRGLIGVEALADRLFGEFKAADGRVDEALLTLADLLIVLREVDYTATETSLSRAEFNNVFLEFLRELVEKLDKQLGDLPHQTSLEVMAFWKRVVERCAN